MSTSKTIPVRSEFEEQVAVFKWAALLGKTYAELNLLNASLNGVKLSKAQAGKAKASGMKAGYPDLFLPVPTKNFHGLYIELKRRNNSRIRTEQREWLHKLSALGYACYVCRGSDAAIKVISNYLGIKHY